MPQFDAFKDKNDFDPIFKVKGERVIKPKDGKADIKVENEHDSDSVSFGSSSGKENEAKKNQESDEDSLDQEFTESENEEDKLLSIKRNYVLGMLSKNREVFIFDK